MNCGSPDYHALLPIKVIGELGWRAGSALMLIAVVAILVTLPPSAVAVSLTV
jgi:hypothetical protein